MSKPKIKATNPPKTATLTEALRWHLRHCGTTPFEISRAIDIHSSTLYRFLGEQRGLSDDTTDRLAKHLKLRLVRDAK